MQDMSAPKKGNVGHGAETWKVNGDLKSQWNEMVVLTC